MIQTEVTSDILNKLYKFSAPAGMESFLLVGYCSADNAQVVLLNASSGRLTDSRMGDFDGLSDVRLSDSTRLFPADLDHHHQRLFSLIKGTRGTAIQVHQVSSGGGIREKATSRWFGAMSIPQKTGSSNSICTALGVSPCGRYLVAGLRSGELMGWDLGTGSMIFTTASSPTAHLQAVSVIRFISSGVFVTGSLDGTVKIWNLQQSSDPLLASLADQHTAAISDIYIGYGTERHCRIFTAGMDGLCCVYEFTGHQCRLLLRITFPTPISRILVDAQELTVFAASAKDPIIYLQKLFLEAAHNLADSRRQLALTSDSATSITGLALCWGSQDRIIASDSSGRIAIWSISGQLLHNLAPPRGFTYAWIIGDCMRPRKSFTAALPMAPQLSRTINQDHGPRGLDNYPHLRIDCKDLRFSSPTAESNSLQVAHADLQSRHEALIKQYQDLLNIAINS